MSTELDCGRDAGAYVLGALDPAETAAFRRHLAICPACREEVEMLERAADALPLLANQVPPPPQLRERVMGEVRDEVRRGPGVARTVPGPSRSRSRARGTTWLQRPVPRPALIGFGALAILAVVTVVLSNRTTGTQLIRAQTAYRSSTAYMELTGQRGELLIKNMPAPPKGKVYEVWIKRGTAAPAPTEALFDVNHAGRAVVDVPASLQSGDAVLVTAEPAGGALTPTPPVLIAAEVS